METRSSCTFESPRIFERFFLVGGKTSFNFFDILVCGQTFRADAAINKGLANGLIIGDVFLRDFGFPAHVFASGVMDGYLRSKILSLQNNRRSEIGERSVVGYLPLRFHSLGAFSEKGLVALAADKTKVPIATSLLVDDKREFLFGVGELSASRDPLGFKQALLDELSPTGLNGEIGLSKSDFLFPRVAILRNQVAGVTGEHHVLDYT